MRPRLAQADETPAIEAHELRRRFRDFVAVDHVSFTIPRGEIFGFLGSNGCGKSTTIKMLVGFLPATSGTCELFGQPMGSDDMQTRRNVGYMTLQFVVHGWTGSPIAGSLVLFGVGAAIYALVVAALEAMLRTLATTTGQFGSLAMPVLIMTQLLSGSSTPMESMPVWLHYTMKTISPTPHFVALAQACCSAARISRSSGSRWRRWWSSGSSIPPSRSGASAR